MGSLLIQPVPDCLNAIAFRLTEHLLGIFPNAHIFDVSRLLTHDIPSCFFGIGSIFEPGLTLHKLANDNSSGNSLLSAV